MSKSKIPRICFTLFDAPVSPRKPPPNGALNVRQLLSLQCPQGNGLQGQEKGLQGQLSPQWAPKKGPAFRTYIWLTFYIH